MDLPLSNTPVTGSQVATYLKSYFGPDVILKSIESKKIGLGQGYNSDILSLSLTWASSDRSDLPRKVILKVPNGQASAAIMEDNIEMSDDSTKRLEELNAKKLPQMHQLECDFYEMIGDRPPMAMPRCYARQPGLIILEDFSDRAAVCFTLHGLTHPQITAAITEIARLHAWSLTTTIPWRQRIPAWKDDEVLMRAYLEPELAGLRSTKEQYPDFFESVDLERLEQVLAYENQLELMTGHKEYMDDCLIHGDYYKYNVLFEKTPDGNLGDKVAAIIDFQVVTKGNPFADIGKMMSVSVSRHVRRQYELQILQRYFDEMKSIAGDRFPLTFDQTLRLYKRQMRLEAAFFVAWCLPIMTGEVRSEGEQRQREEVEYLENVKAMYDDFAGDEVL